MLLSVVTGGICKLELLLDGSLKKSVLRSVRVSEGFISFRAVCALQLLLLGTGPFHQRGQL